MSITISAIVAYLDPLLNILTRSIIYWKDIDTTRRGVSQLRIRF